MTDRTPIDGENRESLLKEIFQYYGIQWPQLAALVGILASGLGLQGLNPASWTAGAFLAFLFMYTLRFIVTSRYVTLALALMLMPALALITFWAIDRPRAVALAAEFGSAYAAAPALASFSTALIGSGILAMLVISYRKYALEHIEGLPPAFMKHLQAETERQPFLRRGMSYIIRPKLTEDNRVEFDIQIEYSVQNISPRDAPYIIQFPAPTEAFRMRLVTVDDQAVDIEDRQYHSPVGIRVATIVPAGKTRKVRTEATEWHSIAGQEMFTSYSSCIGFSGRVELASCAEFLRFRCESWMPDEVRIRRDDNEISWQYEAPLLSYRGVRLSWRRINDDSPATSRGGRRGRGNPTKGG